LQDPQGVQVQAGDFSAVAWLSEQLRMKEAYK